jgi:hypothetical protein
MMHCFSKASSLGINCAILSWLEASKCAKKAEVEAGVKVAANGAPLHLRRKPNVM